MLEQQDDRPRTTADAASSGLTGRPYALTPGQRLLWGSLALGAVLIVVGILVGVWLAGGPLRAWVAGDTRPLGSAQPFEPPRPVTGAKVSAELAATVRADYPAFTVRTATLLQRDDQPDDPFWRFVLDSTTTRDFAIQTDYDRSVGVGGQEEPWRSSDGFFSSDKQRPVAESFMPTFVRDHPDEIVVVMAQSTMFDGRKTWTVDTVTYNGVTRQHSYLYRGGRWVQSQE